MMLTIEEIREMISSTDFIYYGIRVDDEIKYSIGDVAYNSHQLFQDPTFDNDGNLVYPYIEDGAYKGFYDAGELNGTCVIGFTDDDMSIKCALERINAYYGRYVHILGGDFAESGYDSGEMIIRDAEVLGAYEK